MPEPPVHDPVLALAESIGLCCHGANPTDALAALLTTTLAVLEGTPLINRPLPVMNWMRDTQSLLRSLEAAIILRGLSETPTLES